MAGLEGKDFGESKWARGPGSGQVQGVSGHSQLLGEKAGQQDEKGVTG